LILPGFKTVINYQLASKTAPLCGDHALKIDCPQGSACAAPPLLIIFLPMIHIISRQTIMGPGFQDIFQQNVTSHTQLDHIIQNLTKPKTFNRDNPPSSLTA